MRIVHAAKLTFLSTLLILTSTLIAPVALGQSRGFGGGGFFTFGGESPYAPHVNSSYVVQVVGIYGEWLKPRVHPGLDLRYRGGTYGEHGTLVGPRASVNIAQDYLHPYIEALFGPNEVNVAYTGATLTEPGQPVPNPTRDGVTIQGVLGLDFDVSSCCRWRLEFTQSSFSGIPNSHPHAITTGIVIHFR